MTDSTALSLPMAESFYPLIRFAKNQYSAPKNKMKLKVKAPKKLTLAEFNKIFVSRSTTSRSPTIWKPHLTAQNVGMVEVAEGIYPVCCFDVEDHDQMKKFLHFIPLEPASKLIPALFQAATEDPEDFGFIVNSGSESSKAKHQARLDALNWEPSMCQSSNNRSGVMKPCIPSPLSNGWGVVPVQHVLDWAVPAESATPVDNKPRTPGIILQNRKRLGELLPRGVKVTRTDELPADQRVAMLIEIPVGADYTTKEIDGVLFVTTYKNASASAAKKADEAEDEVDEEAPGSE